MRIGIREEGNVSKKVVPWGVVVVSAVLLPAAVAPVLGADEEPPVRLEEVVVTGSSIGGNDATFPCLSDVLGRYLFVGLTANFL